MVEDEMEEGKEVEDEMEEELEVEEELRFEHLLLAQLLAPKPMGMKLLQYDFSRL